MYDAENFDKQAEIEAIALDKMHKRTKDKRLRFESSSYGMEKMKKLFDDTDLMLDNNC